MLAPCAAIVSSRAFFRPFVTVLRPALQIITQEQDTPAPPPPPQHPPCATSPPPSCSSQPSPHPPSSPRPSPPPPSATSSAAGPRASQRYVSRHSPAATSPRGGSRWSGGYVLAVALLPHLALTPSPPSSRKHDDSADGCEFGRHRYTAGTLSAGLRRRGWRPVGGRRSRVVRRLSRRRMSARCERGRTRVEVLLSSVRV